MLGALHALPNVLDRLQPPHVGSLRDRRRPSRAARVQEFMQQNGDFIHALELNGLRHWDENREVSALAAALEQAADLRRRPPRSGAERQRQPHQRHHLHRVRARDTLRRPQPRSLHAPVRAALEAPHPAVHARCHPQLSRFPEGSRTWDERVYHPDANGVPRL